MKATRSKYARIDALSKIVGLILLAVSIDYVSKGNYYAALFLFFLGVLISIMPFYIKVKT